MANSIDLHITFLQKQQKECANDYNKANQEWISLVVDLKEGMTTEQFDQLIKATSALEVSNRMSGMYTGMRMEAEKKLEEGQ
jgi:light-regulated signal transduction histidine kinase (bacteriophytochrome)